MELDIQSEVSGVYESKDAEIIVEVLGLGRHTENSQQYLVCSNESNGGFFLKNDSLGLDRVSDLLEMLNVQGVWRHYKSALDEDANTNKYDYAIVGEVSDLETDETLVVYAPLYEKTQDQEVDFWLRPKIDFYGEVEKDTYSGPRFIHLEG